ncbi:MAG: glycosyltransferase [Planctomycetota bacterium]|nr:MAG: glycosyltransferase [Planctomycetota bacterium]
MVGHLRPVKDPMLTAKAVRKFHLPYEVYHWGAILDTQYAKEIEEEKQKNPYYHYLGEIPRRKGWEILAKSYLFSMTSIIEGGANALGEAIAIGIPVVASRIPGNIGLLGESYEGYFTPANIEELGRLLQRLSKDQPFYLTLKKQIMERQRFFHPSEEKKSWKSLLHGILEEDIPFQKQ